MKASTQGLKISMAIFTSQILEQDNVQDFDGHAQLNTEAANNNLADRSSSAVPVLPLHDPKRRATLPKHLPEITYKRLWLLVRRKVTPAVLLGLKHQVRSFVPSEMISAQHEAASQNE